MRMIKPLSVKWLVFVEKDKIMLPATKIVSIRQTFR